MITLVLILAYIVAHFLIGYIHSRLCITYLGVRWPMAGVGLMLGPLFVLMMILCWCELLARIMLRKIRCLDDLEFYEIKGALKSILANKEVLSCLIGINPKLDKIIETELKR